MAKKNIIHLIFGLFVATALIAGCATSQEIESLRTQVNQAMQSADQAQQDAKAAKLQAEDCCTKSVIDP